MNVQQIILGVLIVIIIYLIYSYFFHDNSTKQLDRIRNAKEGQIIKADDIPHGTAGTNDYTYSIWLYINDWSYRYGHKKVVVSRPDPDDLANPTIYLHETLNNILVNVRIEDGRDSNEEPRIHGCLLENVPLQKWFNLIVTLNNRALDLYIDGKLVRTCILPGVPKAAPNKDILITTGGGFSGKTGNFKYMTYAINPRQAYDIYREGFGGGSFLGNLMDKYGVKFSLMVDNEERYNLKI